MANQHGTGTRTRNVIHVALARQFLIVMAEAADTDSVTFSVGELFESFAKLDEKLNAYKAKNYCEFWKRDARTIEAAKKRIDRPLNPVLKYYKVKYCCIHGGQTFKPKGKGIRNTS